MLKIRKSYCSGYIVYDEKDFQNCHTHTKHLRIASVIRNNVDNKRIPKSRDMQTIISHIRVSKDPEYIKSLQKIIREIEYLKSIKRGENING